LRKGMIRQAFGDVLSSWMVGVFIAIASGALHGDDDEQKKKKVIMGLFSQYFEAIPFLGQGMYTGLRVATGTGSAFQSSGVQLFPAMTYVNTIPKNIAKEEWDKALLNLVEAAAFTVGLPVSGPRRAFKVATTGDWEQLLGWPAEKKE